MIVELPIPTIVTVVPAIVATSAFELVYVKAPALLDAGSVIVKGASPSVFAETEKFVIIGVASLTTNVAVIVPDEKLVVLA